MGMCFQRIQGEGPKLPPSEDLNLANGWVWVIIRIDSGPTPADWHLQGVAADETLAVEICQDDTYLIGPLPFNTALPHDRFEWVGSYFPLKRR